MNKSDVTVLYKAFIKLCDFIETEVGCGKCPMYSEMCCNSDKMKVDEFSQSLMRIRNECGIKR